MKQDLFGRRGLLGALGTMAGALVVGTRRAAAQTAPSTFRPALHDQDQWMDRIAGKHRVVCDVTTPAGVIEAFRFVGNIFEGNRTAYGVEQGDLAVIVILRHQATSFGYGNGLWAKYNAAYLEHSGYKPESGQGAQTNPHLTAAGLEGFVKRGVQFGVCATASRGIIRRITTSAEGGEAIFKEVTAGLIPNSRLVPAGVIALTRAQEYGYSVLHIG
jgi:hypothetical protein